MANKTQENDGDVAGFLVSVENPTRRADAKVVLKMMERVADMAVNYPTLVRAEHGTLPELAGGFAERNAR